MGITTINDGVWYGVLIIGETTLIPYRICENVIERANKHYRNSKPPGRKFTGTR